MNSNTAEKAPTSALVGFGRALAAEWRKLWAVRATAATLISLPFIALIYRPILA